MNSPQFVFTTARCVSSGFTSIVGAWRGSGSRGSGASTAVQPGTLSLDASSPPPPQPPSDEHDRRAVRRASAATGQRAPDRGHVGDVRERLVARRAARVRDRRRAGVVGGERQVARARSGRTRAAGTARRRGRSASDARRRARSSAAVLGITCSRPRAPALEVAPGWNSDSTSRDGDRAARAGGASRAPRRRRRSGTASGSGSGRSPVSAVTGIAGMCATGAGGLPALASETVSRSQAAGERDDEEGSQPPRHEAGMLAGDRARSRRRHERLGERRPCTRCRAAASPPRGRRASRASHGIGATPARARRTLAAERAAATPTMRERPALAVHRLQVGARVGRGTLELEDQLARLERRRRRGRPRSAAGTARRAAARARSCAAVAPSASSAAARSDGCADAQKSFAKIACSRCSPSRAWQRSPPCSRHGNSSRQYQQRVDWSRLPPIEPMLRSCGDAASRQASRSASGICGSPRARRASCRRRSAFRRRRAARRRGCRRAVSACEEPVAQQRHDLGAAAQAARSPVAVELGRG